MKVTCNVCWLPARLLPVAGARRKFDLAGGSARRAPGAVWVGGQVFLPHRCSFPATTEIQRIAA